MKKILSLLLLTSLAWFADAQEAGKVVQTIKGKVIDAATNEPVSYTNIGLEDTYYGTASNAEGNFELKIPAELVSKNIYFSAVGFKNKTFPARTLFAKEFNVIKLDAQSYGIDDIDIPAQSKVLLRILRMAAENTPYNFIGGPLNLNCTYENKKTTNGTNEIIQKANVVVFDKTGYTNPSKLNAFKSRKYTVKKDKLTEEDYRFSTGATTIDELLGLDWVRTATSILNPGILADFQLSLDSEPTIDENPCWIIAFKQNDPTFAGSGDFYATAFNGKITIAKDDYSVKKIEGNVRSEKNNPQGKSLAIEKSNTNYYKDVSYNFTIKYNNLKPDIISLSKQYSSDDKIIKEQSNLTITKIQTANIVNIENRNYFTGE